MRAHSTPSSTECRATTEGASLSFHSIAADERDPLDRASLQGPSIDGSGGRSCTIDAIASVVVGRIGELRRRSPPRDGSATIQTAEGYWGPRDGGGGVFIWMDTTADSDARTVKDDGGTVLVPDGLASGYWQRIFDGPIDVRWFGARGDGRQHVEPSDDACIQAAIDAAQAHGGGAVLVPAGDYWLKEPLVMRRNVRLLRDPRANSHRVSGE